MRLPAAPKTTLATTWPPVLAAWGPGPRTALHRHHAMHFVLAVEGELRVRTSESGRWSRAAGVLTAPDVPHAIDAGDVDALLVFFDPESDAGVALRPAFDGPVRLIRPAERDRLVRDADPHAFVRTGMDAWGRDASRTLGLPITDSHRVIHPRIRDLLARLRDSDGEDTVSLDALAASVGLSPGRLMHVFTESVGIPLRPYLAWLRVQRAASTILSGASLTDAAHAAGFADSAHMSRTFRRMLGVTPTYLRSLRCDSQLVQDT